MDQVDDFLYYLSNHSLDSDPSCDMGPHYWCACTRETFYSHDEWLKYHSENFRREYGYEAELPSTV